MGSRRIRIEHCRTINSGERILPIRPLKICPMGCRASTHIFHFILPLKFGLAVTPFLFNNILASEYNSFVFYNILASHGLEFSSSFVFNDIPASFPVFSPSFWTAGSCAWLATRYPALAPAPGSPPLTTRHSPLTLVWCVPTGCRPAALPVRQRPWPQGRLPLL